ncbi:MAG: hypothetical protein ACFFB5_15275 [Promethearchaeota archaeon]
MADVKVNTQHIEMFRREIKRLMTLLLLFLATVVLGLIVRLAYPQTIPLSYLELQELLPPIFLVLYLIAQVSSFFTIFFAGYFLAEYRIARKTEKCSSIEDELE